MYTGYAVSESKRPHFQSSHDESAISHWTMESQYMHLTENTMTEHVYVRPSVSDNAYDRSPVSTLQASTSNDSHYCTLPGLQQTTFIEPSTQSSHSVPRGMSYNDLCNSYSYM